MRTPDAQGLFYVSSTTATCTAVSICLSMPSSISVKENTKKYYNLCNMLVATQYIGDNTLQMGPVSSLWQPTTYFQLIRLSVGGVQMI